MSCVRLVIRQRRTVYDFLPEPVPEGVVEEALAAAVWAPNHGLNEPWRFWVIGPETQAELARHYATLRASKRAEVGTSAWQRAFEQARARFEAIPRVIMVGCVQDEDVQRQRENEAAVSCAIQNMLLALWEQGYGSQWSTGPIIRAAVTRRLLAVPEKVELVAAVYVGRAAQVPVSRRTPWQEQTRFLP